MNKILFAFALVAAPFFVYGQGSTPSFQSGTESFSTSPIPATPPRKIEPEKEKLIRALLARTKEVEMAQERIFQAMAGMKQLMPRLPEKYWEQYRSLISPEELQNELMQVYDRHFSMEELQSLIQFYDSPAGKKLSEEAVPILRESMRVAQEVSKRASSAVAREFRAEQLLQAPRAAGSLDNLLPKATGSPAASGSASPTATPASP